MPMDSVSEEEVKKLMKQESDKEQELFILINTTIQEMWLNELDTLKKEYIAYSSSNEKKSKKSKV